jgi:hypothetical protein
MILPNASSLLNCSRSLKTSERLIFGYFFSILAPKRTTPKLRFYLKEGKKVYTRSSLKLHLHIYLICFILFIYFYLLLCAKICLRY